MKYFVKRLNDKLVLCSRDIQVGDKVKADVLGNGVLTDWECSAEGEEEGVKYKTFKGGGVYEWFPEVDPVEEAPFKVIGEISPKAIWVKEGDEFDNSQVIALESGGLSVRKTIDKIGPQFMKGGDMYMEGYPKIYVLCPTCNHFH